MAKMAVPWHNDATTQNGATSAHSPGKLVQALDRDGASLVSDQPLSRFLKGSKGPRGFILLGEQADIPHLVKQRPVTDSQNAGHLFTLPVAGLQFSKDNLALKILHHLLRQALEWNGRAGGQSEVIMSCSALQQLDRHRVF